MSTNKKIKFIKILSELGAGTRGASKSFEGLCSAAEKKGSNIFKTHKIISIEDENESLFKNINYPKAKRIKSIYEVLNRVCKTVKDQLTKKNFPILISGDHSIAIGTIAGIKSAYPNKKIGVVWVDAHADIHTPFTTPSGNMHGMPIGAALGIDNILPDSNNPKPEVIKLWRDIKKLGGITPNLLPENLIYVGVRDMEWQEKKVISDLGISLLSVDFVRKNNILQSTEKIMRKLNNSDLIYVSFDVDVLDSSLSLGTGTPVPNGLFLNEIISLFNEISKSKKLCCFEIVEINPTIDNKGNAMAELGLEVLENLIESITS
tara:strand:- start:103 stop:1059 length:957 start_codon:yes stop_codon:yes gene_type:complete